MVIGRFHAYGKGSIYPKSKSLCMTFLADIFQRMADKFQAQKIWSVFERNCIMGKECYLGLNAWCTNLIEPEAIRFGNRVYCRGIIRCGSRGRGCINIGNDVYIGDDTIISSENNIEIGNSTMISHGVQIFDTIGHPVDPIQRKKDWMIVTGKLKDIQRPSVPSGPIKIGKGVWIGFNTIILKGVTIGDYAVVGAGSVVVDDIPSRAVVAGNPAHIIKTVR